MTENEQTLYNWLQQACTLLAVEARDHEENRIYDSKEQRRNIAKTLRGFIIQATNVLQHEAH